MKRRLVFATHNPHKLEEIRAMMGDEVDVAGLSDIGCEEDIPETADTLEGNALLKARYVHDRYHCDCFADDTGLEVEALGGAPGVHTARYAYPDRHDPDANTDKLLDELKEKSNRRARFRTVVALILNGEEHLFDGCVEGWIAPEKRGAEGFGYDPVFIPAAAGKTFAELGAQAKNRISHRARAVARLRDFLKGSPPCCH